MPDIVHELLVTETALEKLAARDISPDEAQDLLHNHHVVLDNPRAREPAKRQLLIGRTNGGRVLTLVIECTIEPTTWLLITGWSATDAERKLVPER